MQASLGVESLCDGWCVRLLLHTARVVQPAYMKAKGFYDRILGSRRIRRDAIHIVYSFRRVESCCYYGLRGGELYINNSELITNAAHRKSALYSACPKLDIGCCN